MELIKIPTKEEVYRQNNRCYSDGYAYVNVDKIAYIKQMGFLYVYCEGVKDALLVNMDINDFVELIRK